MGERTFASEAMGPVVRSAYERWSFCESDCAAVEGRYSREVRELRDVRRMIEATEARAFDAVSKHARFADLVALTRGVALRAAKARTLSWLPLAESAPEAERGNLTTDDAKTELGNVWTVLEQGPKTKDEKALLAALWAHALAENRTTSAEEEDALVARVLWLAAFTPFDATPLLDRALGDAADPFWHVLGDRLGRLDAGETPSAGRAELLVGTLALRSSSSSVAAKELARLATRVTEPAVLALLARPDEAISELRGELIGAPRHPLTTVVLACTGVLFVSASVRLMARLALAYRRPADVTLTATAVRVRSKTLILGRQVRERDVTITRQGLVRATREVRYPRAAFYAGLLSLALGSLLGVRTFVDGVRAASPSLLFYGLLIVVIGIALDFLLSMVGANRSGECRVIFVGRDGTAVSVRDVDTVDADRALRQLATPGK